MLTNYKVFFRKSKNLLKTLKYEKQLGLLMGRKITAKVAVVRTCLPLIVENRSIVTQNPKELV